MAHDDDTSREIVLEEENIEETLTFYRLPRAHHRHIKSTNMLDRLNEEIRRRTRVVRIFANAESCLGLASVWTASNSSARRALAAKRLRAVLASRPGQCAPPPVRCG